MMRWAIVATTRLLWLLFACNLVSRHELYVSGWMESEDRELEHPDVANLLKYPICEDFLLTGVSHVEEGSKADFEWPMYGGVWFPKPENFDPSLKPPGKWLQDAQFACRADHSAVFHVNQATGDWGGWQPNSVGQHLVQSVGGSLHLDAFWDRLVSPDVSSPCQIDDMKVTSTFLMLRGAFVSMETERRLCMLTCAMRPPSNLPAFNLFDANLDQTSYVKDCSMIVKMKYPKVFTVRNRLIEGELTSMRKVDDPMYFPPVSIIGPDLAATSYEFSPELALDSTHIDNKATGASDVDSLSSDLLENLAQYLGRTYLEALRPPSRKEQDLYRTRQRLQLGPFTTYPLNHSDELGRGPLAIRLRLNFRDVLCRPSSSHPENIVLVSAVVDGDLYVYQTKKAVRNFEEQSPFTVEGTWNSTSKELHMRGCRSVGFSRTESHSCDWELGLHSVLRKFVTVDTPRGAVLRSSLEPRHLDYFQPFRFTRVSDDDAFTGEKGHTKFNVYLYTNVSKALELAKKNRPPEMVKGIADKGLKFPGLSDVENPCSEIYKLQSNLDINVPQQEGQTRARLRVTHVEECDMYGMNWSDPKYEVSSKPYDRETYLRVAVKFDILQGELIPKMLYSDFWPHHAEGVYEPYTGQMHLVANLRREDCQGGTSCEAQQDHQVYVKIQYPPLNPPSPRERAKIGFQMESLRSPSDFLFFAPIQLGGNYNNEFVVQGPIYNTLQGPAGGTNQKLKSVSNILDREYLVQITLIVSIMGQIMYSRTNKDVLPYISQSMLTFQALCQMIRSLAWVNVFRMAQPGVDESDDDRVVRALAMVVVMLLVFLIIEVQKARSELRLVMRKLSGTSLHHTLRCPPSEWMTLAVSSMTFGLILVLALNNSMSVYSDSYFGWVFYPISLMGYGTALFDYFACAIFGWKLLQDLYLLPQMIANILCDVHESPLSPSFIWLPSLIMTLPFLKGSIYYYLIQQLPGGISSLEDVPSSESIVGISSFGAVAFVYTLAVIVFVQQRYGGRCVFRFFSPCRKVEQKLP